MGFTQGGILRKTMGEIFVDDLYRCLDGSPFGNMPTLLR